jgi:cell wall-associated NlpC family hydrolase
MRLLLLIFLTIPLINFAQNKQYDKLEMLYDQGHYKKVLRNSDKLLRKPEHQQAILPHYYKSLAQLQLFRNEKWRKKNPKVLEESVQLFVELKRRDKDAKILKAHSFEIQSLKRDYDYFLEELEQDKKSNAKLIERVQTVYKSLFLNVEDIQDANDKVTAPPVITNISDLRKNLVKFAYKYQGTKYRSGGNDPNGFDCSGFVNFVFNEFKIDLPRISRDQQKLATPLKALDVQPGDLVFFASGSGVNHVGIVVENKNGFITMIHSSTSQGIVVTDINTSNYWKNRVHSYGTFLKD